MSEKFSTKRIFAEIPCELYMEMMNAHVFDGFDAFIASAIEHEMKRIKMEEDENG